MVVEGPDHNCGDDFFQAGRYNNADALTILDPFVTTACTTAGEVGAWKDEPVESPYITQYLQPQSSSLSATVWT